MKAISVTLFILVLFTRHIFGATTPPFIVVTDPSQINLSGASVETFDPTVISCGPGKNASYGDGNYEVLVGSKNAYTFPSGVTLVSPIPNLYNNTNGNLPMITAFSTSYGVDSPASAFGFYGNTLAYTQLPGGSHSFLFEMGTTDTQSSFTLSLPGIGSTNIGGYWAGSGNGPLSSFSKNYVNVVCLDMSGSTLGNASILDSGDGSANNWNFTGMISGKTVKYLVISYYSTDPNGIAGNPAVCDLSFVQAQPSIPTWSSSSGTLWGPANWNAPSSGNNVLFPFISGITSQAISISGTATTGSMLFSDASPGYSISGSGTSNKLILDNSGSTSTINVLSGNENISANVLLKNDLLITPTNGGELTLSGDISETNGSHSLTLNGPGTLVLSGTGDWTGGTNVDNGELIVESASALPSGTSLTVGAGGTLIFDPSLVLGGAIQSAPLIASKTEAVPEPSSISLLAIGAALLFFTKVYRLKR
jgi:fibronectin-binding autotransporter adhesin